MRRWPILECTVLAAAASGQTPTPTPTPDPDDLYALGQQIFDQVAPPEVKAQYDFPTREQWDGFARRLDRALQGDSLEALADLEPEARSALPALRAIPGYEDYADWLEGRIDEIDAARQAVAQARRPALTPPPAQAAAPGVPLYGLWASRVHGRPLPRNAPELMPRLRAAFAEEGVPPELAWLAEAESSLNPSARSPSGAAGLFQLMPETAHLLGLSTFLPDERTSPERAAHASAHYLRILYGKLGSWPLALAAYNAGEGRVRRALAERGADTYAAIASSLPAETRMYVPKVCALVALRTGVVPGSLAPPRT